MTTIVKTQEELDAALAALNGRCGVIEIRSPRGVWLTVSASGSATVSAYGSATVSASDSATVSAYGSATVSASGSATVSAYGSATVSAYGSATVRAYDSATVRATPHVAVHLHSASATVEGGVVIDVTDIGSDATRWAEHHGIDATTGKVTLFKAVDANLISGHGFAYPIGETLTAPDWRDTDECGYGLHLSPWPHQAATYHQADTVRYLACQVDIGDVRVINGGGAPKCKVRQLTVVGEVDIDGRPIWRRRWWRRAWSKSGKPRVSIR